MNLTKKDIETILKNEVNYKIFIHKYKPHNNKKINVNNNYLIQELNFIDVEIYNRASLFLKAIEMTYKNLKEREKLVYKYKYHYKLDIKKISYKISYSVDTIYKDLENIKKSFKRTLIYLNQDKNIFFKIK